jgi:hypothetical protein
LFDISPDGAELAFTHDFNPDPRAFSFTDIVAMDVATRKFKTLTQRTRGQEQLAFEGPRYAPDGRHIAMLAIDYSLRHNEQSRAWLLEVKSKKLRNWSGAWDRGVNGPLQWAADSTGVYFVAEHGIAQPVWRLGVADAQPVEVCRGPGEGGTAADLRISRITPHVAQNVTRSGGSAIDGRTARHQGYAQSINTRKRIEQVFGWIKQAAGLRQLKARGRTKVGAVFRLHVVAYNLIRITNLLRIKEVMA